MKAISIRQPFAWAIIAGLKLVENRTWRTHYRGPIAIHAGQSEVDLGSIPEAPHRLYFGGLIGLVDLIDCVPLGSAPESRWTLGPWCWILANPRPILEPIPWKGRLGLFEVPDAMTR